ncbi:MAG: hypothetical protein KGJ86_07275, partial [Chloroflexota bacterium]|nr:hypothetical protein [Chloroflexota bacterium]
LATTSSQGSTQLELRGRKGETNQQISSGVGERDGALLEEDWQQQDRCVGGVGVWETPADHWNRQQSKQSADQPDDVLYPAGLIDRPRAE